MANIKLSIIVVSYNTKKLLYNCLSSIVKSKPNVSYEVIVSDNNSKDKSVLMVEKNFPQFKLLKNKKNLGFAKGNNRARKIAKGKYILFLNSDTILYKGVLEKCIEYMEKNPKVGAMSCRVELKNGSLDPDTRRAFITPWIGFIHIFTGLDRIFPKSKVFGRYWYGYIPDNIEHEVDVIQGAFFLSKKKILDKVGWFDEDYFLDGEDVDLCWKIKSQGYKIMYWPKVKILHIKGSSKGKNQARKNVPLKERIKFRTSGINSMELFVKKRLSQRYPKLFILFVLAGVRLLKIVRITKEVLRG